MPRPSLQRFWDLLGGRAGGGAGGRTVGDPPSANGASSLHLRWDLDPGPSGFREVSVTLEVLEAPQVDRLHFWALQADVADAAGRRRGGAHLGLQWHPGSPGCTAVNWGGYDAAGRELDGSRSELPSTLGNPNTCDLAWRGGVAYRLRIHRVDAGGGLVWRGSVTEIGADPVDVRDLYLAGDRITGTVMWSEVFARCDHPSTSVRWSDPEAVTVDGETVRPHRVSVNYQSHADGGCANTTSVADDVGIVQRTNAERSTPQGAVLAVPGAPPRVRSGP